LHGNIELKKPGENICWLTINKSRLFIAFLRSAASGFTCITPDFSLDPVVLNRQSHIDAGRFFQNSAYIVTCFPQTVSRSRANRHHPLLKPHHLSYIASAIATAGFFAAPAKADFRLCNNTSNRLSVALAYTDGDNWVSEGWWNLKSSACETLLRGPLAAEFYYVYAMDERSGEWKGKAFMCTHDHEFHIIGRQDCFVRGFDRTGFFEVDTGKEAKNWTVQLTDPATPRPAP